MTTENTYAPLATRMRPHRLTDIVGQPHLTSDQKPLFLAVSQGRLHSMILWGPPGTGKTTLAHVLAASVNAEVEMLSAVLAGVKDIREVMVRAKMRLTQGVQTVLFLDEVHRFNKSQQDALLPHIESGEITFIGATTENPSFQLNNALLSRARVYVLKPITADQLVVLLKKALTDVKNGLGAKACHIEDRLLNKIAHAADGDARRALNTLEIATDFSVVIDGKDTITEQSLDEVLTEGVRRFDQQGDVFYDQISALHKSVRGSDPDAALYWFCRMIDAGADPHYIMRRVVRMASEDIGNADPRALELSLNAWQSMERLGSPEGELMMAQAIVYCAIAAKSNAVYKAFNDTMAVVKSTGSLEVPPHLRNAPTKLAKSLGHGKAYRYAHDEQDAFAKGEVYLPDELKGQQFYEPVERGLEIKIKQKLDQLRSLNQQAQRKEETV